MPMLCDVEELVEREGAGQRHRDDGEAREIGRDGKLARGPRADGSRLRRARRPCRWPEMTWTLMSPAWRIRSWVTEPSQHSRQRGLSELADDDMGDIVLAGVADDFLGDVAARNGRRPRRRASRQGAASRQPVARPPRTGARVRGRLDVERRPGRAQPLGQAPAIADERRRARLLVDADQDPLAGRPGPGDGVRLHVGEQLLVDALGRAPQRQLPQRRQVAGREVVLERALGRRRDIDLALFSRWMRSPGVMSMISMSSARSMIESGTVSRTLTRVIWATTSFRLSTCWMLSVV